MDRDFKIKQRGKIGEEYVCDYLKSKGYVIVCRNYSSRYGEIDVIAQKEKVLAFVEVKTRTKDSLTGGFESITRSKVRKMLKTIADYLMKNPVEFQPRIDCASVIVYENDNSLVNIDYMENAVEQEDIYAPF